MTTPTPDDPPLTGVLTMPNDDYAAARRIYDEVKRAGRRVLTLPEIQRVIDAHTAAAQYLGTTERLGYDDDEGEG